MTRDEKIDSIQSWVLHGQIETKQELEKQCELAEVDWYDDILCPMSWNCCDRCGILDNSEELHWVDYDTVSREDEKKLLKGIELEKGVYASLCLDCIKALIEKGGK